MRYFRFIAAERVTFPISLICRVLGVSRSGFHAWARRPPSERVLADASVGEQITEVHAASRQTFGARRIHAALRRRGVRIGRKWVERLMRALGSSGLIPTKRGETTIRVPRCLGRHVSTETGAASQSCRLYRGAASRRPSHGRGARTTRTIGDYYFPFGAAFIEAQAGSSSGSRPA